MITASGDPATNLRVTSATILALVSIRSMRLMPGLRGRPAVITHTRERPAREAVRDGHGRHPDTGVEPGDGQGALAGRRHRPGRWSTVQGDEQEQVHALVDQAEGRRRRRGPRILVRRAVDDRRQGPDEMDR